MGRIQVQFCVNGIVAAVTCDIPPRDISTRYSFLIYEWCYSFLFTFLSFDNESWCSDNRLAPWFCYHRCYLLPKIYSFLSFLSLFQERILSRVPLESDTTRTDADRIGVIVLPHQHRYCAIRLAVFQREKIANETGNCACDSEIARNHAWRVRCIGVTAIGLTAITRQSRFKVADNSELGQKAELATARDCPPTYLEHARTKSWIFFCATCFSRSGEENIDFSTVVLVLAWNIILYSCMRFDVAHL